MALNEDVPRCGSKRTFQEYLEPDLSEPIVLHYDDGDDDDEDVNDDGDYDNDENSDEEAFLPTLQDDIPNQFKADIEATFGGSHLNFIMC